MHSRKTTIATALTVLAVLAWIATAAMRSGAGSVVFAVAAAASVAAVVVTIRQVASSSVRHVTVAVARAPRDSYWRGYEDRGTDSSPPTPTEFDTVDLRSL